MQLFLLAVYLATVVHAFVSLRLECCNTFYMRLYLVMIQKLKLVQNMLYVGNLLHQFSIVSAVSQ